jgi:hypothetical protein
VIGPRANCLAFRSPKIWGTDFCLCYVDGRRRRGSGKRIRFDLGKCGGRGGRHVVNLPRPIWTRVPWGSLHAYRYAAVFGSVAATQGELSESAERDTESYRESFEALGAPSAPSQRCVYMCKMGPHTTTYYYSTSGTYFSLYNSLCVSALSPNLQAALGASESDTPICVRI